MAFVSKIIAGAVAAAAFGASAAAQTTAPPAQAAPQAAPKPAPVDPLAAVPPARAADVASIDAIMKALYDVISGDAGVKRDWNRLRSLFYPGARMMPTGKNSKTGKISARMGNAEEYISSSGAYIEREGFHERELARHVDSYGNIAQVFSSYEARHKLSDPKPFLRGINSFQLLNDGNRWWVLSLTWSQETPEHPLPKEYSKKKGKR